MGQIHRQIRGPALHDGQSGDDELRRSFDTKADQNFRSRAERAEIVGQLRCLKLQLGVGQLLGTHHQRNPIRVQPCLGSNHPRHQFLDGARLPARPLQRRLRNWMIPRRRYVPLFFDQHCVFLLRHSHTKRPSQAQKAEFPPSAEDAKNFFSAARPFLFEFAFE